MKTKSYKIPFILTLLVCLFLFAVTLFLLKRGHYFDMMKETMSKDSYQYLQNASYGQRQSQFEMLPERDTDIVFLGDSITARFEWQNYFTDLVVSNRGIDSDVCEGVYHRVDTVINQHPQKIFIMIGINDIRQAIPSEQTLDYYEKTILSLQKSLPQCKIYLQSVLPVNTSTNMDNTLVQALNEKIKELAAANSLTYIDLYSKVVTETNDFTYTIDGVHPTGEGYQIWMNEITPYVYE